MVKERTPSPWGDEPNAKGTCVAAGATLAKENMSFKVATPTLYQSDLAVSRKYFEIPSSELAMHKRIDGLEIIAFFITALTAYVVYDNGENGCGYTQGLIHELLSPELAEIAKTHLRGG